MRHRAVASGLIFLGGVGLSVLANLMTAGFDLGAWRWWLTIALVLLAVSLTMLVILHDRAAQTHDAGDATRPPPWSVPPLDGPMVARGEMTQLIGYLIGERNAVVGVTTALYGAGGFGKTVLAKQVCQRDDIRAAFPGGLLWVSVGEEREGAQLASVINDLCNVIGDHQPGLVDVQQAGFRLGQLLDAQPPTLLVLDDVWRASQLDPFLSGGARCTRLVTTRVPGILPEQSNIVLIDQMSALEAGEVLNVGAANLPTKLQQQFLELTGRWPLLLGLVNAGLRWAARSNADPAVVGRDIANRLAAQGPTVLDPSIAHHREDAVAATIQASLNLLSEAEQVQFTELAIFADNTAIPGELLRLLWSSTDDMDHVEARLLCGKLAELSLVSLSGRDHENLGLHDVFRAFLRSSTGQQGIEASNQRFLKAALECLPSDARASGEWWQLPKDAAYLWRHLAWHMAEAGQPDRLIALVTDLRWVEAKLRLGDLASALADLDLAVEQCLSDRAGEEMAPVARELRAALTRSAHLLFPAELSGALSDILISRLDGVPALHGLVSAHAARQDGRPRLSNRWLPPDIDSSLLLTAVGHTQWVHTVAISADGRWLASCDFSEVRVWDAYTGSLKTRWDWFLGNALGISADGSLVFGYHVGRGDLEIRDAATGDLLHTWHPGHSSAVAFSADGAWLVYTNGKRVQIHDTVTGEQLQALIMDCDSLTSITISADRAWIATGSEDGTVAMWDARTGSNRVFLTGHTCRVCSVAISQDNSSIAASCLDGTVRIWDTATGQSSATLSGHLADIIHGPAVAISPDGKWAAATIGTGAKICDIKTGLLRRTIAGHSNWATAIAISPDGTRLATSSRDSTVRIWEATTNSSAASLTAHGRGVAASPDGAWTAFGSDNAVHILDTATGAPRQVLTGHTGLVFGVAVSSDGTWIASCSDDATIRIWDVLSGETRATFSGHAAGVYDVAVSPDDTWIASCGKDGTVRIWDAATGHQLLGVAFDPPSAVTSLAISPDGTWIVAACNNGEVHRLSLNIGDEIGITHHAKIALHSDSINDIAISPDGAWVATAAGGMFADDCTVGLWSEDGAYRLFGHTDQVHAVAFSPDGRFLATGGGDCCIRIWETATRTVCALIRADGRFFRLAWVSGASVIAAAGTKGLYLFDFCDGQPRHNLI